MTLKMSKKVSEARSLLVGLFCSHFPETLLSVIKSTFQVKTKPL